MKSEFLANFDQNPNLSKILAIIEIVENFDQNRDFSKTLNKIEISSK